MDYKKIFKTSESRELLLNLLSFLPDSIMLKLQYFIKLNRRLNLSEPERFTEKIQWYKMNYRNPLLHQCVDKYLVREYVKGKKLEHILIPLIGKYQSLEEVSWENLPNQFVIKTTEGSGGLNVVVCSDKQKLPKDSVVELFKNGQKLYKENSGGREWAYYGLRPGIVVEELLINSENPDAGINDYKIFCYNGKPQYIIVDVDRFIGHKRNFYDTDWNKLDITSDCPNSDREIRRPENLLEMLNVASKLSEDFPFVRVDLYSNNGQIYFGELTFYPWSGYVQIYPDEFDYILGSKFELPCSEKR